MSGFIENRSVVPGGVRLSVIAICNCLIIAPLTLLGPVRGVGALIGLLVLSALVISPVGFSAVLFLVSHVSNVDGVDASNLRIFKWLIAGGLFFFTVLRFAAERRIPTIRLGRFEKVLVVFLAWGLVCALLAENKPESLAEILRLGSFLVIYLVARETITRTSHVRLLLLLLLFAVLSSSAYSLILLASGRYIRAAGFLETANGYGLFLNFSVPMLLAAYSIYRESWRKWLFGAGAFLGAVSLLLSWSRASWIALFAFALVWLILNKRKKLLIATAVVTASIAGLLMLSEGVWSEAYRLARLGAGTTRRTILWEYALKAAVTKPITGHGFALKSDAVRGEHAITNIHEALIFSHGEGVYNPHNFWLAILLATGVPGLILIVLVHYYIFKKLIRGRAKARRMSHRIMYSAVLAMLAGSMLASFFERGPNFGSGSYATYFWLILGMLDALSTRDIEP